MSIYTRQLFNSIVILLYHTSLLLGGLLYYMPSEGRRRILSITTFPIGILPVYMPSYSQAGSRQSLLPTYLLFGT